MAASSITSSGASRRTRSTAGTDICRFTGRDIPTTIWPIRPGTGSAANGPVLGSCSEAQRAALGAAHCYFTDVSLRSQDGQERYFYSDLLKGKVVVISSFFTSCMSSCPIVNATLADLQDELRDPLGTEVHILSITSDPLLDTPEILSAYARRLAAREGWFFLIGDQENVGLANHKLGFAVETPAQHVNVIIVGNEATGLWEKISGATGLPELGRIIDDVLHDR